MAGKKWYRDVKRRCDGWDTNPHPNQAGVNYAGFQQLDSFVKRVARCIEQGPAGEAYLPQSSPYSFLWFQVTSGISPEILTLCPHASSHSQHRLVRCLQLNSSKALCAADGSRALRGPPLESIPVPRHQGLAQVPQIASPNRRRCRRCNINIDCLLSTKLETTTFPTPTCTTSRRTSRCILFPGKAMCLP